MATISPIYVDNWINLVTTIKAPEVRGEFLNLYSAINGNLDGSNLATNSISTSKVVDNAITDAKISSVSASKITGAINPAQLPTNIATTSGGTYSGTLVFSVPTDTAIIKDYDNTEVVVYEGGTGANKVKLIMGGAYAMRVNYGGVDLFVLSTTGTFFPKAFRIPLGT